MLKDCIAKAGKNIPPAYAERMLTRVEALVSEGTTVPDAEQRVIREVLAEVRTEAERLAVATPAIMEGKDADGDRELQIDLGDYMVTTGYPDSAGVSRLHFYPKALGPDTTDTATGTYRAGLRHELLAAARALADEARRRGWAPDLGNNEAQRARIYAKLGILEGGDRVGQEDQGRQEALLTDAAASTGPEGWPSPLRTPETDRLRGLVRYRTERNALDRERQAARNAGKPVAEIDRRIDGLDAAPRESLGDDAAYLEAVARGDTATAQRMVDEAAWSAGYRVGPVWHGSWNDFTVHNRLWAAKDRRGMRLDTVGSWFTDSAENARAYGPKITRSYLRIQSPAVFDGIGGWDRMVGEMAREGDAEKFRAWLRKKGHDGIQIAGDFVDRDRNGQPILQTIHIALDPSQIKSAEPVTRDSSGNVIPLSQRFNPASPDIRENLDEATARVEADRIRQEYPSAPEFVIESGLSGDDPRKGAVFRDGKISIYPTALGNRRQARNAILGALGDAGAELFEPSFWDRLWTYARAADPAALRRLMVRADTSTPAGRRAVLGELLMEHSRGMHVSGPLRRMIRALKGYSTRDFTRMLARHAAAKELFRPITVMPSTDKTWLGRRFVAGTGYEAELFPTEEAARAYAGDAGTVRDVTQEKAHADLHGSWYRTLSPRLANLRTLASESGLDAAERQRWENLERHLRGLAEEAEAAALPAMGRIRVSPEDESFPEDYAAMAGKELSPRDLDAWNAYRAELEARRAARMIDRLAELERTDRSLTEKDPRWGDPTHPDYATLEDDRKRFRAMTTRLRNRIAKFSDVTRARADEIRGQREVLAQARAAETVLADPFWVQAAEIIDRIDDAGVAPSALEDLAPITRAAAEAVRNQFHAQYLLFRQRAVKMSASENERIAAELRKLRERLTAAKADAGAAEVAIKEVRDALAGAHGTSGSLESRAITTALRDLDTAIQIFARELAAARPDTPVWKLREIVEALDPTVPLELREEYRAEVASAMGLSLDALSRILDLIQRYDEFRNGILAMHDAADRATKSATITAIERIEELLARSAAGATEAEKMMDEAEADGDVEAAKTAAAGARTIRIEAHTVAARAIARLRRTWKGRERLARSLDDEIADTLVEQLASDFLLESASEEVSDPGFVREMIYNTDDGEYLAPFTRADGTAQPGIHLRPGDEYTPDLLARVSEWRDHARDVAAAPPGSTLNDAETVRGLAVAISAEGDAGVSKYIDAMALPEMRSRAKAPGKALIGLATHSKFGIKTILPALVPGVLGNRLRAAGAKYVESEQRINRVLGEKTRTQHRLIRAATISLGLNPRTEAGKFTAAYNEVAHRLRQFDSGVAPGDILWSRPVRGREVTPELLALFRFHRDVFGQLQDWLGAEPYGGVRMRMPGRRVIRAPAPTGDIGLGRYANKARVKKLAEASREAAETGTDTPLLTFWNKDPDALLFHVFDSTRNDLGTTRDPVLLRAEQEAARDLHRRGKDASVPSTVDEWADYLATFITTVPDPRRYARERLLGELAEYGNLARALFPTDSKAAATGAGLYKGENDANEFNTPATKLLYPSSWYTYGASDGLRAAVERTADRRQVEYFAALLAARDDLNARATRVKEVLDRIEAGVDDPTIIDPVREDVRWHTDHIWKNDEVRGRHRVAAAYALMRQRAAVIEAHYGHLSDPRIQDPISRALSNLVPMMLSWYPSMLTNVVSGPVRQGPLLRPLLGNIGAGATVPLGIGASILSHAYEALVGALPKSVRERFKSREEILAWLLSKGLGTSYSREEMAELEAFAGGLPGRSRGGQVWGTFLEGVRVVSERVGVHMGDKLLNRYASRFIVPLVVWRLRTIARAWRERVGPNPDPTNPDHALSAADVRVPYDITRQVGSGDVARIREILTSTGLGSPEDVLAQLEREDVKPRLFWRSKVGNAIGMWVLNEFNVANRLNRPAPSFLGFLWGWAAGATAALIEDARSAPDDRLASRVGNKVVWTTAVATTAALATWARLYSIPLAHAGVSAASAALAAALSPDDDEDEWGLFDHIMDGASRIVGAFQNYTIPKQLPHNRSFWMNAGPDSQPGTPDDQVKDPWEIAGAVGKMVAAGYGWDFDNARTPGLSILYQFIRGGIQFGRGMAQWAEGKIKDDAGMVVGGESDTREGARQLAALTSVWGRTLYNARYPDDQEGRQGRQAILRAANELGIQPAAPPPVASFITPTPVRREFQETGRAILDGDPDAPERARSLAAFVWNRSYDRSIRAGDTEEVARKNADAAVKRNLSGLNPYEASLGRTLTPAQYEQLKKALGDNPMIRRDEAAAEAIIRAVSEKPPEGMLPFAPSPAMLSPVRSESGSRGVRRVTLRSSGGGGRRRRSVSITRTRGIRRRTRLPKPRKTTVRVRWA